MQTALLCAILLNPAADAREPPPAAAMVLRAGDNARVQRGRGEAQRLWAMDMLYPGDRLEVPRQGEVVLVFANDGHKEQLRPGARATIGEAGCTPTEAGAKKEAPRLSRANLSTLREDIRAGRIGGVRLRSVDDGPPLVLAPVTGATVLGDRPGFSWPDVRGAERYTV